MLTIERFWKVRLAGAQRMACKPLAGWSPDVAVVDGFVEPSVSVIEGDPNSARLLIIAAPGAVGKSSYSTALANATQALYVDLARTNVLGGQFFDGGLLKAAGLDAPRAVRNGKIALVVDALDEAQMRANPSGYKDGLLDLAEIVVSPPALPAVLLGRALAAEQAYLELVTNGFDACLLQIDYFSDEQAARYLTNRLSVVAKRSEKAAKAYSAHGSAFCSLAETARQKLIETAGTDKTNFSGYAPVLDAICAFALDEGEGLNPQAKIEKLKATSQIELVENITHSILEREQTKLQSQFKEQHAAVGDAILSQLYTVEEQLHEVAFRLFGGPLPVRPNLQHEAFNRSYLEMVEQFAPQHPFLTGRSTPSSPVFAALVIAWGLRNQSRASAVRAAVSKKTHLLSGILFEFYDKRVRDENGTTIVPLADVGILYQALNAHVTPRQRVELEVEEDEENKSKPRLEVRFGILDLVPDEADTKTERTWGPYSSTSDTILELHAPFSHVYVDAPSVTVALGDGNLQKIGAPTELSVDHLSIYANQVLIQDAGSDSQKGQLQTVALVARETGCDSVQTINVQGAALSVTWPNALVHPWTAYAFDVPSPADENIAKMRRRLRRILTAFRSHSKGALRRLAAKIDHRRMLKDEFGSALVGRLVQDKILTLVDSGKFYELHADVMGQRLGVGYHELQQSRFKPETDSYLLDVLNGLTK